ncbi:MAG: OsmC family protein [Candidatus Hodarchaeota archaeon]
MSFRLKYPKNLEFQINAKWDGQLGGIVEAKQGYHLKFDIPHTFGGPGQAFCPDELFLASIAGCLLNTFLHFQERIELEMKAFLIQVGAEVEFERDKYRIIKIKVDGTLTIKEGNEDLGTKCLQLAKDYCHISRSLTPCIPIEYHIGIESAPK